MKRVFRGISILWILFFGIEFIIFVTRKMPGAIYFVFLTALGFIPLFLIKVPKKQPKNKQKDSLPKANGAYVDGPPFFAKGTYCNVILNGDILEIHPAKSESIMSMHVNQIGAITSVTDREIIKKRKSIVGRAATGGILFGGLGAIVGGMSGIPSKKKVKMRYFLVINYRSIENNQMDVISFETFIPISGKFLNAVQAKIPAQTIQL